MRLRILAALALLCLSAGSVFGQTSFTLTSSPNPSVQGQTVFLSASGAPSATTVTFYDNGVFNGPVIGSASTGNSTTASFQTSTLSVGTHQIIACYSADVTNGHVCTNNTVTQTVNSSQPFVLTTSPNPSTFGQAVNLTATGAQSGQTVTFYDGGSNGSGTVIGSASTGSGTTASTSVSTLSVGTHSLSACFPIDFPALSCTSPVSQTVNQANISTSTSVSSSANPATPCQSVTFTATVTATGSTSGSPTGTVTFFDGSTQLGQPVTLVNGSASVTGTGLTLGTHQIRAQYTPNSPYLSSSGSLQEVVSSGSTITISSAPNPSNSGQAVTITAAVAAVACPGQPPPSTLPTGTVFFFDGPTTNPGNLIGQSSVVNGTATFSTSTLAVGTHQLDAQYGGDANYSNSTSNTDAQVVNGAAKTNTTTTLTTSANPITTTQSLTLTATVTPASGSGTPTGQVQFKDGANVVGTATLSGGTASTSISNIPAGTHPLTAVYQGDTNFNTSTSNTVNEVVNPPGLTNSTASLSVAPNPATFGQAVTLTASVAPASGTGTPTGQVQFKDGGTVIGSVTLSGAIASFTTSTLTVGTHSLTASYLGDANFNPSTSNAVTLVVNAAVTGTTTTVTSSANPSPLCQLVTFTAAMTPANATGTVTFSDGSNALATVQVSGGTASFSTSNLTPGNHQILAAYSGDPNHSPSSGSLVETISGGSVILNLTGSPNPSNFNQTVTLTATLNAPSCQAAPSPTGAVTFSDGGTQLGQSGVASGTASFSTSTLAVGNHTLSARYSGDTNYGAASSNTVSQTVNPLTNQSTSTSLAVTPTSANPGQAVIMSATVTPAAATGTVTFTDNGSTLANVTLNNGSAGFQTTSLSVGSHTIVAVYQGNTTFNSSSSNAVTVVINGPSTQTALSVNPTTSTFGQTVALTANVNPVNASGTPTGTITFSDGTTTLGTANLSGGAATFSISTLSVGSHSLVAAYSGDSTFGSSSSLLVSEQVNKAPTTTVLTAAPTSSNPGQAVVLTAKVGPTTGTGVLTGTVTFMDGTAALGAPVSVANGSASMTTSSLSTGSHSLTAVYSGDGNFLTSTSAAITESVGLTATTTTLTVTPASPTVGQAVTMTATVTPTGATGTVKFLDGATTLSTQTLTNGTAAFTTSSLSGGAHSLSAVYSGDTKFATSTSSAVTVTLSLATSTTALTVSPTSSTAGSPVTLSAKVTPSTATGTVTFRDGNTTIGTGTLSSGAASFTTSTLAVGTHSLTASYGGDANNGPSTSAAVTEVVTSPTPGPSNIQPVAFPNAIVGVPYSVTFTVTGGAAPLTWTLVSGSVAGLTFSPAGVLSGTPTTPGTTPLGIRVTDSNGLATAETPSLTVLPAPAVSISPGTPPATLQDQPIPTVTIPGFPDTLTATFTLSFTPDASVKGLPTPYTNPDLLFSNGTTTSTAVTVPANSTVAVSVQPVQLGSVAGVVTVRLASLTDQRTGQTLPLPSTVPSATITVKPAAPVITSVKITAITSSSFQVVVDAASTTRDLSSASLTFTAASGTQLNGSPQTVSLSSAATLWFVATGNASLAKGNGGAFSVTMTFPYSGDTTALGTASVTLTNSVGTSPAVSGGR